MRCYYPIRGSYGYQADYLKHHNTKFIVRSCHDL